MRLGLVALGTLAVLLQAPCASAHAYVVQSHPANGEQWDTLPTSIHLLYTEGLQRGEAVVLNSEGERVDTGTLQVDSGDARNAYVALRAGGPSVYVLQWKVLSVDTHVTSGTLYFVVGNATPTRDTILSAHDATTHQASRELFPSLAKGLLLAGLGVLGGLPVIAGLVARPLLHRGTLPDRARLRARRALLVAASVALLASTTLAVRSLAELSGAAPAALGEAILHTATGRLLLLHVVTLGFLLAALALWPRSSWPIWIAPGVAVACQIGVSLLSHSGSFVGGVVGTGADLLHLGGSGLWFGGLVCLLVVVLPELMSRPVPGRATARLVRHFSPWALAGLTLTAAAGLLIASWFVPAPESLARTDYGVALVIKTALLGGAVALAAWNRLFWVRRMDTSRTGGARSLRGFRKTLTVEAALLASVFLLSGFLTTVPTAVAAGHGGPSAAYEGKATLGATVADLTIVPAGVGFNVFDVELRRNGQGWNAPEHVTLLLRNTDRGIELPGVLLEPQGEGRYSNVTAIPFPGNWSVRYSYFVEGEGFQAQRVELHLAEALAGHPQHAAVVTVSEGPLRIPLALGAVAAALLGGVVLAVELVMLRRERRPSGRT